MDKVKIALIGVGNMGSNHVIRLESLPQFEIAALCDINPDKLAKYRDKYTCFTDYHEMLLQVDLDAVMIATPHWLHPTIGADVLDAGKHLLVEKPIGVHAAHAQILLDAIARHPELKVAAMFNQRRIAAHIQLKKMIEQGELGAIKRVNWIITDWYRTQRYYDSGDWRASWRGEGGGVLTNQCPHQLDLMQWFFGMPSRVTAQMSFGKYHDIEVEDEVTAFLEYPSGATGVFIASTGEAPGTNRLEIACDRGKVLLEKGQFSFWRTEETVSHHCATTAKAWSTPTIWECQIPGATTNPDMHKEIIINFGEAIMHDEPLIANAAEGINGLTLGNAMLLSALEQRPVTLPLDRELLAKHYERLVANSRYEKKVVAAAANEDFSKSFDH